MAKAIKLELTESQIRTAKYLFQCSMIPGSFDKRFSKEIQGKKELTQWQIDQLERLTFKYRAQISKLHGRTQQTKLL